MFDINQADLVAIFHKYIEPWSIKILLALTIFLIGQLIAKYISHALGKVLSHTKLDNILVGFIQSLVRAFLLVIVLVAVLDQVGVNTNSVIAVLGAAGLAIGLALQGSLQNFAAGFMLLIFRPFKAGDYVETAGTSGMIEKIGIFSTVMHTPDNKEVIIPNSAIYSGNIINYSKRGTRRIDLVFSIDYSDDLRKAREVLTEIVKNEIRILPEPETLIAVGQLGANSVDFFVRPWVRTDDYWAVKFDLTEKVKLAFDDAGITIPFPQMNIRWDGNNVKVTTEH